ncbi:hypothetical protein TSAR_016019 [Trichomalopsis sarcophagae]|uniref:SET domain-containing protein n=1 Tax=Trichomalopsis sarcophagae TaxID=543379 RepID=A0A232EET1_9HYME|nr:hypothetical protein TSAR_016019 [Trichomalopsis sarcophagae]
MATDLKGLEAIKTIMATDLKGLELIVYGSYSSLTPKSLTVTAAYFIDVRKFKEISIPYSVQVKNRVKTIYDNFKTDDCIEKAIESFVKVALKFNLLYFLQKNAIVKVQQCNRYSLDNHKGVTIIAKSDIKARTVIHGLFGVSISLSKVDEHILWTRNQDFSILMTYGAKTPKMFLGSLAFVNHDCCPNSKYFLSSSNLVSLKTTRPIKKGEELFVEYSNNYFGKNNENCECNTCKERKKIQFYLGVISI